ncbi:MAG TPA: hypothetical protein VE869_01765 [Gemmatimonas sp.]|nr:hypothetical protein [Gemmatimonas sp.]
MPDCALPLLDRFLIPCIVGGFVFATLAAVIGHSILQTFLEARGVVPWSLFDSLTSLPLLLLGAGAIGAAVTLAAGLYLLACPGFQHRSALFILGGTAALGGLALLRAGLLGVRRLT